MWGFVFGRGVWVGGPRGIWGLGFRNFLGLIN
jgi:hypothetical protein